MIAPDHPDSYRRAGLCDDTVDAGGNTLRVGDVVTRLGDDRHRIIEVGLWNDITVECISAPDCSIWQVGDRELNLAARYRLVVDEAQPARP